MENNNIKKARLSITGMTCAACSSSIQRSLGRKDYIKNVEVDLISNSAILELDTSKADISSVIKHIEKLGYGASEFREDSIGVAESSSSYLLAIIFAIPLFVVSMGSMFFHFELEWAIFAFEAVLLLPILYAGRHIYKKGIMALFKLIPNMDTLVMLGSASAIVYSLYAFVLYTLGVENHLLHNAYLESAGVIIAVIMLGKNLESRATNSVKLGINSLSKLSVKKAFVRRGDSIFEINVSEIAKDDIVIIPKGAMLGVDGILLGDFDTKEQKGVESAEILVDESIITGESKPKRKVVGEKIFSGSINLGEQFEIKSLGSEADSVVGKIISLMQDIKKAPIARLADRVSYFFVPSVIAIAIVSATAWLFLRGDFHFAFVVFTSVLLISCPCALGLATPISVMIATSIATKRAIYFKNAESIENASKISVVVFDKTGTLTKGNLKVVDFVDSSDFGGVDLADSCLDSNSVDLGRDYIFALANALESKSEHLIANAIKTYTQDFKQDLEIREVKTEVGRGISGVVDGRVVKIGNADFVENLNVPSDNIAAYISVDGVCVGYFSISDDLRENANALVKNLESLGISSVILSGDNEPNVRRVAESCGILEFHHSKLPNEKLEFITKLQESGKKVAFIGDGVNDILAIKKADIGISLSAGNDIALKTCDIILLSNNLNSLYEAIIISKKALRNIKENLCFAFVYNMCAIPVACGAFSTFGIMLNPMIAGVAMGLSSISVVLNAMRLNRANHHHLKGSGE